MKNVINVKTVCGLAEETVRIEFTIINVKIVDLQIQPHRNKN